jgi:hypothetical protein
VPFSLPLVADDKSWLRVMDTIEAQIEDRRFAGGTKYPLQGRTLVLFTLNSDRRQRRARDGVEV